MIKDRKELVELMVVAAMEEESSGGYIYDNIMEAALDAMEAAGVVPCPVVATGDMIQSAQAEHNAGYGMEVCVDAALSATPFRRK